jgi:hypothetical protein
MVRYYNRPEKNDEVFTETGFELETLAELTVRDTSPFSTERVT